MKTQKSKPTPVSENPQNGTTRSLWTLAELAAEASVCRRFLELEITRGRLVAIRISNRVRVRERDWQAYLNAGATGGAAHVA